MRGITWFSIATILGAPGGAAARNPETGFLNRSLQSGDEIRNYQVYVPREYTPERRWPVILFLHGSGERGDDGILPTEIGIGTALRRHPDRWPAIVVFPQARPVSRWSGRDAEDALAALDATLREFSTDPDRVYLTGLSRGGAGAWYLAYRNPERFAAVLVACGRVRPADGPHEDVPDSDPVVPLADGDPFDALARRLSTLPIWIFHGDADPIIPVQEARGLAAALERVHAPARYTELPGVGHGSWDAAFDSEDAIRWLFEQTRAD
ncbi:MAG: PHB depolymerase family esterase [bacterium]